MVARPARGPRKTFKARLPKSESKFISLRVPLARLYREHDANVAGYLDLNDLMTISRLRLTCALFSRVCLGRTSAFATAIARGRVGGYRTSSQVSIWTRHGVGCREEVSLLHFKVKDVWRIFAAALQVGNFNALKLLLPHY